MFYIRFIKRSIEYNDNNYCEDNKNYRKCITSRRQNSSLYSMKINKNQVNNINERQIVQKPLEIVKKPIKRRDLSLFHRIDETEDKKPRLFKNLMGFLPSRVHEHTDFDTGINGHKSEVI